ncbi:ZIP family metal transporter [Natronorubrum aibiense]
MQRSVDDLPRWILAVGPVFVLIGALVVLSVTAPFEDLSSAETASTVEIVWMVTIIGAIAGLAPVAIGMLWFPFIRDLDPRYLHAFMALAAGVLAFIAVEMSKEIVAYGATVASPLTAGAVTIVGVGGTFVTMHVASAWRQHEMASRHKSGLHIAYLVALALGLHSIGEGLGIGVAYVQGDATLVMLLVLAFVMHNVMEGPTIVAAVARETETPPLRHFAAMGIIAGAPVILGGWVGSFANAPLVAMLFYAIAIGAIVQVLLEVAELIRFDAEAVLSRTNTATFVGGFVLMFVLEDVLVDVVLEGWLVPV